MGKQEGERGRRKRGANYPAHCHRRQLGLIPLQSLETVQKAPASQSSADRHGRQLAYLLLVTVLSSPRRMMSLEEEGRNNHEGTG